ncbi:NAD(P)H-dependent oxidoreductase [Paenalkalicoccus suaedae]|uniref:FMN dependent NADH:quinone oxidoreductase n=1 Tax=Paenalkalicoccus suaedae TaxID=2592382 RepID=A0A859FIL2_9BACI|nr:NAD(P)H-dependent oxidoreductase [Paenalkalicoccus suaedae]QKS72919.1 NAD(P)H-dependent oxidoreductase [Paenalkalicoccus suaedae]
MLYVTANPKPLHQSNSLQIGQAFLETYTSLHPGEKIEQLDLFDVTVPTMEGQALAAWERGGSVTVTNPLVEQLLTHDKLVLVTPLWNMGIPAPMKAYVDQIVVPNKTFRFAEKGMEGLLGELKVLHIQSRGGIYSEGKLAAFEHGDSYLRTIFKLVGVKHYEHLFIEGTSTYPEQVEEMLKEKVKEAKVLAERF